jgi:acyl-CoA synthetase (AMP-forming)/AMP-acid ligase II
LSDSTPPSGKFTAKPADPLSVASLSLSPLSIIPLLDAFENFRGSFFDLEHNVRISADQLRQLRAEVRQQMQYLGLGPGDRLIAAPPNGALFAAVWAASLETGASPILVHSDTPDPELRRMAETWGARFLVSADSRQNSRAGSGEALIAAESSALRWQRAGAQTRDRFALPPVPLHPTSGTSGGPKIAVRPGPCAVAEPLHYIETLSLSRSDVILCALPMSHAYAYGMCLLVSLLTSADLLFLSRFHPALLRHALHQKNVSVFPAVPVMLDALLAADAPELLCPPRIVLSAGAPLRKETFTACRDRWGVTVRPLYGTTETGGISIGPAQNKFDGSVGPPMKGVEVDLRGFNGDFGPNTGVLRVHSPSMMSGYLEQNGINSDVLRDGWFETGDLARIDSKGAIHLQGRLSDVINVLGFKVAPKEVEDVIVMLPEVREVKVYAGRWRGQVVVEAAVATNAPLDEETILKHCDQHLVSYKCPGAIRFVDSLPRTPAGKVAVERLQSRDQPL